MAAVAEPALNAQEVLPKTQAAAARVLTASVESKIIATLPEAIKNKLKNASAHTVNLRNTHLAAMVAMIASVLANMMTMESIPAMVVSMIRVTMISMVRAMVASMVRATVFPALVVTKVVMQDSQHQDKYSQDLLPVTILMSLVASITSSARVDLVSLEEDTVREVMATTYMATTKAMARSLSMTSATTTKAMARRLFMATTTTTKLMAISINMVQRRVTAMKKAMDATEAMVRLIYTWRRKATEAKKATETRKDMVQVTTMARKRATVMTKAMDMTPSTATALASLATVMDTAIMANLTTSITNLTAMTRATARSRTTDMTSTTAAWINMLVKSPMATRRNMATRKSTASPPSTASTTNILTMIPMVQSRVMALIRAMARNTLVTITTT